MKFILILVSLIVALSAKSLRTKKGNIDYKPV
jgi:hypothetical protein